jgi:hypothetical protein
MIHLDSVRVDAREMTKIVGELITSADRLNGLLNSAFCTQVAKKLVSSQMRTFWINVQTDEKLLILKPTAALMNLADAVHDLERTLLRVAAL